MKSVVPASLPRRQFLLIAGLFWTYVALSNVLYAHNFSVTLAQITTDDLFAPWQTRVLQHLLLLGPLLGCFWISLRTGWQPLWRTLPIQAALAFGFAALPHWVMALAGKIMMMMSGTLYEYRSDPLQHEPSDTALWIASGTNFLLQYGFGLVLMTGFALYQRYRDAELQVEALQRQTNAARLSALRMQLSPHTLFNLLNTIRGQISWDPQAARQLVVQLSDLLRKLLSAGEREFSLLADELQFVRLYLNLQQSRFSDRLQISLPPEESLPGLWVPSLILQPLVENAVSHGLAGHDGPVNVSVDFAVQADCLMLSVVNDMGPATPVRADGIGLRNVRERLAVHFGDQASLRTEATAGIWRAEIRLPKVSGT